MLHVGMQPDLHACDAVAYLIARRRSCLSKVSFQHVGHGRQAQ